MLVPRMILTFITGLLGLVLAFVPENSTVPYQLTAVEMVDEVRSGAAIVSPDELAQWLLEKDPSIRLIDVRSADEFGTFSLPDAENVPFEAILSPANEWYFDQDVKTNILYSNGTVTSQQAWMILRQLGYENIYILQGGVNYWTEVILNPEKPSDLSPNEELAKYAFRKGAGSVLGGAAVATATGAPKAASKKPPVIRRKKKKAPEGGC